MGLARARNVLAASHTTELAARFADLARRSVAVISVGGSPISCRACWGRRADFYPMKLTSCLKEGGTNHALRIGVSNTAVTRLRLTQFAFLRNALMLFI